MPITVNIVTGRASTMPGPNDWFEWVNPTSTNVDLTQCGGFCTKDSYPVPAKGTAPAQISANPGPYDFWETPSVWAPNPPVPGQPHIISPGQAREAAEKEVA